MARNVASIFYAAPGVVTGQSSSAAIVPGVGNNGPGASNPSIGGATGLENLYIVDGVTITDQAFGSLGTFNRYHGALGSGVNLAFIKEVDVKGGGFEPQYGKAQGGIVQIVTKSGSNTFHGALAAYFGPGSWNANRYPFYQFGFIQTTPGNTLNSPQYDASAEVGRICPSPAEQDVLLRRDEPGPQPIHQYCKSRRALSTRTDRTPTAPPFSIGQASSPIRWATQARLRARPLPILRGTTRCPIPCPRPTPLRSPAPTITAPEIRCCA